MRYVKPTKSARPDFVDARIAQLQRQLATEKNEKRVQEEISDWPTEPAETKERQRQVQSG